MIIQKESQPVSTDVLVIGGGMAASMAAIEAKRHGVHVTLVDKGKTGYSGTSPKCGGGGSDWALFPPEFGGDPRDSHDVQLKDCVLGGEFMNVQENTELFNVEALERLIETESFGIRYPKTEEGKYNCQKIMAITYPRGSGAAVGGSQTVMRIMRESLFNRGINVIERVIITRLLMSEGRVCGAFGFHTQTGQSLLFNAGAVILAAGSATGVYKHPTCQNELTGDAYSLAYHAGVKLMNMEFLQFSITGLLKGVHVRSIGGIKPLVQAGATWVNARGEKIMGKYDRERLEYTDWWRNVYAIWKENAEGRGPVYLNMSTLPEKERQNWEDHGLGPYHILSVMGLDPRRNQVELIPGLHTFLGGAQINTRSETNLPGLYAAGESGGQGGIFGADRVGGGIPAAQVMGHRAGKYAASFSAKEKKPEIEKNQVKEEIDRIISMEKSKGEDPFEMEQKIKDISLDAIGIARNGKQLEKAVKDYSTISSLAAERKLRITNIMEAVKAQEVASLALSGEMVSRAALMRTESRGAHRREDHPARNDKEWLKWIVFQKQGDKMKIDTQPVPIKKYKVRPEGY